MASQLRVFAEGTSRGVDELRRDVQSKPCRGRKSPALGRQLFPKAAYTKAGFKSVMRPTGPPY